MDDGMEDVGSLGAPTREARGRTLGGRLRSLAHRILSLPLRYGIAGTRSLYLAYQPDSYAVFGRHASYDALLPRFVAHNRRNNAGDVARLWALLLNLEQIEAEGVRGDFAELGVWRGNTAAVLAHFAARSGRRVYLFDTFAGFDARDLVGTDAPNRREFGDTSLELVRGVIGPDAAYCELVPGFFPRSLTAAHERARYAAVNLDCDLYEPMKAGLAFFYPRLAPGGVLILHDYSNPRWEGVKRAVDEFCRASAQRVVLMPDKSGSAILRRMG